MKNQRKQREEKKREHKQRKEEKRKKEKKNRVKVSVPLCAANTNFPKERMNKRICYERKKQNGRKSGNQDNAHSQSCQ